MQNREINKQIQKINDLVKKVSNSFDNDIELQSHWAKYICILGAGLLENALCEIYQEFAAGASSKPVADFTARTLSKLQNPNTTKFIETARAFKPIWAEELEKYVKEEGRKEAIDSIIANRHKIAHGKVSDITLARIKSYLEKSIQVLEFLEKQVSK